MATLKLGMDILTENENVRLDQLMGHGGLFKTEGVGQKLMSGALNVPVTVMESAGEGGAWGIALLARYMLKKSDGETLESYLDNKVFVNYTGKKVEPDSTDIAGFASYMDNYKKCLPAEKAAAEYFR